METLFVETLEIKRIAQKSTWFNYWTLYALLQKGKSAK